MTKSAHTFLVAFLAVMTVLLISKSVKISRDTAMMRMQAASKQATGKTAPDKAADLRPYEMVTAKEAIQGIAWHYKLPVIVEIRKNQIKIGAEKLAETADKDAAKELASTGDYPVLKDFDALVGFFSGVATLPYWADVKDLCVGKECTDGFTMEVELKKNN